MKPNLTIFRELRTIPLLLLAFIYCLPENSLLAQNSQYGEEEKQNTSSPSYETFPALGNDGVSDLVVYSVRDVDPVTNQPGAGQIWYQRLDNGHPMGLPVLVSAISTRHDELIDTWEDNIIYTSYDKLGYPSGYIVIYQISTATTHIIASVDIIQESHMHDHFIVWREGGSYSAKVMLYDLDWIETGLLPIKIAGPVPPTFGIQIGDRFSVW